MCELTLPVASSAVHCILLTCIYERSKLGSYHALFRDGSHSGKDVCVVDSFSNMYLHWIPVAKTHYLLFVQFVVNQSVIYLIINFQHLIPIINRLVVFL